MENEDRVVAELGPEYGGDSKSWRRTHTRPWTGEYTTTNEWWVLMLFLLKSCESLKGIILRMSSSRAEQVCWIILLAINPVVF